MNTTSKDISYTGNPVFTLYPLGDTHLGTIHCDTKHLARTIEAIKNDPHALWIGMGDMCECIVLSDPRFQSSEIAPEFRDKIDTLACAQRDAFIEMCAPIADKCIGILAGNHEEEMKRRHYIDVTMDVARGLGAPYLSDTAFVRLTFRKPSDTSGGVGEVWPVVIYAEHGTGGGRKPGAKINNLLDMSIGFEADIYLRGHVHIKDVHPVEYLRLSPRCKPQLQNGKRLLVLTGSYYRSYEEGSSSYGQRNSYLPVALGTPRVLLYPIKKTMEGIV